MSPSTPPPGSPEARKLGCTCPRQRPGRQWIAYDCPVHTDPSKPVIEGDIA